MMKGLVRIIKENPIWAIILLGFVYRLIFLLSYWSSPQWGQLLVDSLFHDRWAESIASGHILGNEAFFRAPFYVYILGLIYSIFGHSLLAARIFGHLVGLISIFLTWKIANRLFSRRAGYIAALIHALYPMVVYFESELLVDSFFMMLFQLSILQLLVSIDRKHYAGFILTGIIIGIAAITRPLVLALVPIYIIWIVIAIRPPKESIKRAIIVILAMILIILPVTIRNYVVADDFVLIASSGGINFYIGNNTEADGVSAAMPSPLGRTWEIKDIRYAAEKETGRVMKASEISDFWFKMGLQWIEENPGGFLRLYIKKLYYCMNNVELSNNRNLSLFMNSVTVFKINPLNFGIIFALALFSIILMIQNHILNKERLLIIALIISYFALIALFFINARFRLPAVPLIIIVSAYGFDYLINSLRTRESLMKAIPAVIIGGGVFLFSVTNIYGLNKSDIAGGYFNQGNYYLYLNDFDRAEEYYRLTLRENPTFQDAALNLGVAFLRKGQGDSAKYYFMQEMANSPDNPRAYSNLASIYYLDGDYANAEQMARAALNIRPYFSDAYILLMRIEHARANESAFEETFQQALKTAPDDARIYLNAGLIFSGRKMFDRAEKMLIQTLNLPERAAETDDLNFNYSRRPDALQSGVKARAAYQLGYIYGIQDRIPESIDMSQRAIAMDSGLVEAYINLINAYGITGDIGRARELLQIASGRFPQNELLRQIKSRYE
ncbi:MAG: glycosyltransferase family 39 protein [Candidatus Zixiibacteriota bacterium]